MAFSRPPVIRKGGRAPSLASSFAPIAVSGVITRAIGRLESDSSPMSSLVNSWPARIPLSIRIVEPELPQSSDDPGADKRGPHPSIVTLEPSRSHFTPSARRQARVLAQSAPVEKFSSRVVPSAMAASIAYRCEMDLSPGRVTCPAIFRAGRTITLEDRSEEHTSELQSHSDLVCRLLLEKKN